MDLRNSDTGIAIFAWATAPSEITLPGGLKMALWPMYVSADYFKTIGVPLARGPGFEGQTDAAVILGYRFWQNDLSSDPEIIGKTLKLDNVPYVVAGIAPDQFQGHLGLQGKNCLFRWSGIHFCLRTATLVSTGARNGCTSTAGFRRE